MLVIPAGHTKMRCKLVWSGTYIIERTGRANCAAHFVCSCWYPAWVSLSIGAVYCIIWTVNIRVAFRYQFCMTTVQMLNRLREACSFNSVSGLCRTFVNSERFHYGRAGPGMCHFAEAAMLVFTERAAILSIGIERQMSKILYGVRGI